MGEAISIQIGSRETVSTTFIFIQLRNATRREVMRKIIMPNRQIDSRT